MPSDFLLYGSTGFVGSAIARFAVEKGLHPILAGRNAAKLKPQADQLDLPYRVIDLGDAPALDAALGEVPVVLHCAGPFIHTFRPMLDACLRTGTHYLDITGELPVYEQVAARDAEARQKGIMLMPSAGFDVVPTDCLAAHLKRRLPSATHLTIAWTAEAPAGMPPGTFKTAIEMARFGTTVRRDCAIIEVSERAVKTIDFGSGPVQALRWAWGDVFTAYYSTGIPNIEDYFAFSEQARKSWDALQPFRPLLNIRFIRELLKRHAPAGPTPERLAQTRVHIWAEVRDDQGRKAASRLHGPEAGVIWTKLAALVVIRKILDCKFQPGYMTPALAYGPDLVMECEGVTREDLD
jgi:short subunit dehydrogenase-like uncharacterized protein